MFLLRFIFSFSAYGCASITFHLRDEEVVPLFSKRKPEGIRKLSVTHSIFWYQNNRENKVTGRFGAPLPPVGAAFFAGAGALFAPPPKSPPPTVFLGAATVFLAGATVFLAGATVFFAGATVFLAGATVFFAGATVFLAGATVFLGGATVFLAPPI